MPLHFNASSSLHTLAKHLCGRLSMPGKPVFAPHYIVTQTEGMNNWLKLQLAEEMGIAANCYFLTPSDIIYRIYFLLGGKEENVLSTNNLCWLLYKILGNKNFESRFPLIAAYYQSSGPDKDVKRLALAEKMADLFDQYQIYRPEMMRAWNRLKPLEVDKNDWQHYLWAAAKEAAQEGLPDKTRVADFILNTIKNGGGNCQLLKMRMPQVHLFGLSIFTEYHLHLLHELSEIIEVHFHMLNPAPGIYWFEDRSEKQLALLRQKGMDCDKLNGATGHPLLTGWGRVLQDTYKMFFRYDAFLNTYNELAEDEPQPGSLLQKIQHDIYRAATGERHPVTPNCLNDGSLTINSCHTMAREVEVLYNYLVHLIDQREARLSPRDVVVMVSDVNAYGPYIRAVFDNAPYRFRYNVADETFAEGDNLFEALHAVLSLSEESFLAERVMQLLELSYIRKRFGIINPTRLRYLVDAANIRFGIDGRPDDDTRFVSWRYGLKRIMYGICMSGEEGYEDHEDYFYPLDILEGSETQDAVKFCHFAEVLMAAIERRKKARDMAGWVVYVNDVLRQLIFNPDERADDQYTALEKQLGDYNAVNEWMEEPVGYDVFSRSFLQTLSHATRSGLYASGGITFCSLIPMRSIPFKVVAMLGLGFENFPRRDRNPSFNLMLKEPRPGDRSVKENDKHLFLETLLSARDYLYISYLGQSSKDNTPLPPSALVDELLDYIEQGMADEQQAACRDTLVTVHPLHGFSHRYNAAEEKLYCYRRQATAVLNFSKPKEVKAAAAPEEIHVGALIKFFENPVRAYYNHRLDIYYNDEDKDGGNLLSETELFGLDNLRQWGFKNELLFAADAAGFEELRKKGVRTGRLPLANMSAYALQEMEALVAPVRLLYEDCVGGACPASADLEITLANGVLLKGRLENILNEKAVTVCWSKHELKHLMAAYISYLAGVAGGVIQRMEVVSAVQESVYGSTPVSAEAAREQLEKLAAIYEQGQQQLLPFCVKISERLLKKKPHERNEDSFVKVIEGWINNYDYPCDDPYILREYEQGLFHKGAFEQYMGLHHAIVEPVLETFPGYSAQ